MHYARVTLRKSIRPQAGAEEASIVLSVPGTILTATKIAVGSHHALDAAFMTIEQQWQQYRERTQRTGRKSPGER